MRSFPSFYENIQLILVSRAYYDTPSADSSVELIRNIMHITCMRSLESECWPERWASNKIILEAADPFFNKEKDPLFVVEKSTTIPARMLLPSGSSNANQVAEQAGVLYGAGFFPLRIFLASDKKTCWRFGIRAKHDEPAPVNLSLWLENEMISSFSFAKGDLSWETKYSFVEVDPSTYWLRIWYTNDYFDENQKADRNAYVEFVEISRTEKVHCNDN